MHRYEDYPEYDYQVITKFGVFNTREIRPRGAVMNWTKGTYIRAGQKKITDVGDGYWFTILIDENDEPFDCWVRQL